MIEAVAVVVPAHDEQQLIAACLAALQRAAAAVTLPVSVVVVLDACTDATAELVGPTEVVTVDHRNVGRARRAGAEHALTATDDPATLWLASTDADSAVPPHWLSGMLALAGACDVVLGTVVPTDFAALAAWRRRHVHAEGHPHVHGANMGVRGDAYRTIGGWPPLRTGEDVELVRRAEARGLRIARTAHLPVHTSARTSGRAPLGFAAYLRDLERSSGVVG